MKKSIIFIVFILFINQFSAAQSSNEKIDINKTGKPESYSFSFFKLKKINIPADYAFLATSLKNSMRSVLKKQGFKTKPTKGAEIVNIYNRQQILDVGKQLNTDLILTGKYSIKGIGINAKIHLVVLVYDVKGSELVIEKLVVGGTGTGMFVMIDEAAKIVKNEVKKYFKERAIRLEKARKERLRREQMAAAEREKQRQIALEKSKVKTKMNDSEYLSTSVPYAGDFRIFWYTQFTNGTSKTYGKTIGLGEYNSKTGEVRHNLLMANLIVSVGIGYNMSVGIEQGAYYYRQNIQLSTDKELDNIYGASFFNPIFYWKWRLLQDENHGINLTVQFGLQLSFSDTMMSNSIFQTYSHSCANAYHLNIFVSKTLGNFTPFFDLRVAYNYMLTGRWRVPARHTVENYIHGFFEESGRHLFQLTFSFGSEIRFSKLFIIQLIAEYKMASSFSFNLGVSGSSVTTNFKIDPWGYWLFGINTIFQISSDFSVAFTFALSLLQNWHMLGDIISSSGVDTGYDYESKIEYSKTFLGRIYVVFKF